MPEPTGRLRPASRIIPSLVVLGTLALTTLLLGAGMYALGRQKEGEKTFLRSYRPPYEVEARLACMMDYVLNSDEANDVLFLGGSGCLMGIDPVRFDRETGLRSYNLGTWGLVRAGGMLDVFRLYLEHHPKPRVLVYNIDLMDYTSIENSDHVLICDRFSNAYGIEAEQARPSHPSRFYFKEGFRVVLGSAMGGMAHYLGEEMPTNWEKGQSYEGYTRMMRKQRGHAFPPDLPTRTPGRVPGVPFSEVPANREKIRLMAQFAQRQGILMILRISPIRDDFAFIDDRFVATEYEPRLKGWLKTLEEDFPNLRVSRPEILHLDPTMCWDVVHPNRTGAEKFTASLAKEVSQALAEPRVGSREKGPE